MNSDDLKIISGINLNRKFINPKSKQNRIIRANDAALHQAAHKVQIVGGDADDVASTPPTIIIEKEGERIARIIVKCPCGRHSELLCEYDEDGDAAAPDAT